MRIRQYLRRASLHGGVGPQIGGAGHPTYHVNIIKLK